MDLKSQADTPSLPEDDTGHARPGLLVASPRLDGSVFARTVVLLCDYGDEGAMGLVVNRGLEISIGEVMDQLDIVREDGEFVDSVLWGGPVEPAAGLVICDTQGGPTPEGCLATVPDTSLCVSASRVILEAIAGGRWPGAYHLCLGYAGWAGGQLEQEIDDGSWLVSEFDPDLLDAPMSERWGLAVEGFGLGQSLMWIPPIEE